MDAGELHPFEPDWTVRPGVFLRRMMDKRRIGPATLALRGRMGLPVVRGVLDGTVRVDAAVAGRLDAALGTGTSFWLNAQAGYDADIARGVKDTGEGNGEDGVMAEMDAAARAAGYEAEARVMLTHGADALLELPGEDLAVRVPAGEVAAGLGVEVKELPGKRVRVTVRESAESGRALSGFRPAGE